MTDVLSEEDNTGTCSNEACPYAESGECALGKEPIDCEHFHLEEVEADVDAAPSVDEVRLASADALTLGTIDSVMLRRRASIVVPLGHVEAGKTTLLAVIFEHLAARRLEGWSLAGTLTFLGFGRRSHLAMTRSGRESADTGHTSVDSSQEFMHIDARRSDRDEVVSVLVADISGENVRQQVTGPDDPVVAAAIAIADHIPVFLDGRLIGKPHSLQDAIRQAQDILWAISDLPRRQEAEVCLVVTKADLARAADLDEVVVAVRTGAPQWAKDAPAFVTAARSSDDPPPGSGAAEFFSHIARRKVIEPEMPWLSVKSPGPSDFLARFWPGQ